MLRTPVKASSRAFRNAIEQDFIDSYTRRDLEDVLAEELKLPWPKMDVKPDHSKYSKRNVIKAYTKGWELSRLVALVRRTVAELDVAGVLLENLTALLASYDRGGGLPSPTSVFAGRPGINVMTGS